MNKLIIAIISRQFGNKLGKPAQVLRQTKIKPGSVSGQTTHVLVKVKFIKSQLIKINYLTTKMLNLFFYSITEINMIEF